MTTSSPDTTSTRFRGWRLPAHPLRGRVLMGMVAGIVGTAAVSSTLGTLLPAAAPDPRLATLFFAVIAGVAVGAMREHHPFPYFGAANAVTMLRVGIVAITASLFFSRPDPAVALVVIVATALIGVLDGIDGWLARRSGLSSAFGARFDMETDALFMLVLSLLVWRYEKAGVWIITIGLMRYAFVAAGWLLPWLSRPLRATMRGKTVAILQFVALAFTLLPQAGRSVTEPVAAAALIALVWSFAVDVRFLWRTAPTTQSRD